MVQLIEVLALLPFQANAWERASKKSRPAWPTYWTPDWGAAAKRCYS